MLHWCTSAGGDRDVCVVWCDPDLSKPRYKMKIWRYDGDMMGTWDRKQYIQYYTVIRFYGCVWKWWTDQDLPQFVELFSGVRSIQIWQCVNPLKYSNFGAEMSKLNRPPPVFLFGIAAKILVCQCLLLFNRKFWYVSAESSNGFVMVCLKNKVPQDPLVYHQQFPIKIVKTDLNWHPTIIILSIWHLEMEVPKSSILIGFSFINHPF